MRRQIRFCLLMVLLLGMGLVTAPKEAVALLTDYVDPVGYPGSWPDGLWVAYRHGGEVMVDNYKATDLSVNTPPASSQTDVADGVTTATYVYADGVNVYLRFRLDGCPQADTKGPLASGSWIVLLDADGDAYSDFAVLADGADNSAGGDDFFIMWHDTSLSSVDRSQHYDLSQAATVDRLWTQDSIKIEDITYADSPTNKTPYIWDYGRIRITQLTVPTKSNESCAANYSDYFLDIQVPISAFDGSGHGSHTLTADSWFSYGFSTANSNTDVFQKDIVFDGCFSPDEFEAFAFGDTVSATGALIEASVVTQVITADATCDGAVELSAAVLDTQDITGTCGSEVVVSSVQSVEFYYYYDVDGNGSADDSQSWVYLAAATATNGVGPWIYSWDPTGLTQGQYLIKIISTDSTGNVTDSADTNPASATYNPASNGANPVILVFNNDCGGTGVLLSGYLYNDIDGSGSKDTGEEGLGTAAYVKRCSNPGNSFQAVVSADSATGYYSFQNIADGSYYLYESADNNADCTPSDPSGWNSVVPVDNTRAVTVAGANLYNQNFGDQGSTVSGYVYYDANNNNTRDVAPLEGGLKTTVYVKRCDAVSTTQLDIATVDPDTGAYSFYGVAAGTYDLVESADNLNDCNGSDPTGWSSTEQAGNLINDLVVSGDVTHQNFGDFSYKVSGYVYNDEDSSNTKNGTESGLGSEIAVYVKLLDAAGTTFIDVVQADSTTGYYELLGLTDVTSYTLIEDNESFSVDVTPADPAGWSSTNPSDNRLSITVSGADLSDKNFGDFSYKISGYLFNDHVTANGSKDTGEEGLEMTVYVKLIDSFGSVRKAVTADSRTGYYQFNALWADTFTVIVDDNDALLDSTETSPIGWNPSLHTSNNKIDTIVFDGTADLNDQNLGYTSLSISGFVFYDENEINGKDGVEAGLGQTVYVKLCTDGLGTVQKVVSADSGTGAYTVWGVVSGVDYDLIESIDSGAGSCNAADLAGWSSSYDNDGNGNSYNQIDINTSVSLTDQNFGDNPVEITGFVYYDENESNGKEGAEAGLGTTVYAKRCDATATIHFEVTLVDSHTGAYHFTTVADGTYTLFESADNNTDCLASDPTGWESVDPVDNTRTVVVSGADVSTGTDFGDKVSGQLISGYIYEDSNHSMGKESGEGSVNNTVLYVKRCTTGDVFEEGVATDISTGSYTFPAVAAGNYKLMAATDNNSNCVASDLSGWISTTPNTLTITMTDQPLFEQNFGDYHGSKIMGYVFDDQGDGTASSSEANDTIKAASEQGIARVLVQGCSDMACNTVLSTAYTGADGAYTLWFSSAISNGSTVYLVARDLANYRSTGNSISGVAQQTATADTASRNRLSYTMVSGEEQNDYNFADVGAIFLTPDQSYLAIAGDGLSIPHRMNIKTPGKVALLLVSDQDFIYLVFDDNNCDEIPDAVPVVLSGGYYPLNGNSDFGIGPSCVLLRTVIPTHVARGTREELSISAYQDWRNAVNPNGDSADNYDDLDSRIDTVSVDASSSGFLKLEKWVRNMSQAEAFTRSNEAEPCHELEYRIDYKNLSSKPVKFVLFGDVLPQGTQLVEDRYDGNSKDLEFRLNSDPLYYGDFALPDGVTIDGLDLTINLEMLSSKTQLAPGDEGHFKYQVQLNCH